MSILNEVFMGEQLPPRIFRTILVMGDDLGLERVRAELGGHGGVTLIVAGDRPVREAKGVLGPAARMQWIREMLLAADAVACYVRKAPTTELAVIIGQAAAWRKFVLGISRKCTTCDGLEDQYKVLRSLRSTLSTAARAAFLSKKMHDVGWRVDVERFIPIDIWQDDWFVAWLKEQRDVGNVLTEARVVRPPENYMFPWQMRVKLKMSGNKDRQEILEPKCRPLVRVVYFLPGSTWMEAQIVLEQQHCGLGESPTSRRWQLPMSSSGLRRRSGLERESGMLIAEDRCARYDHIRVGGAPITLHAVQLMKHELTQIQLHRAPQSRGALITAPFEKLAEYGLQYQEIGMVAYAITHHRVQGDLFTPRPQE